MTAIASLLAVEQNTIIAAVLIGAVVLVVGLFAWRMRPRRAPEPEIRDPRERLKHALEKTRGGLLDSLRKQLGGGIDETVLGSLWEILVASDMGQATADKLIEDLKQAHRDGRLKDQQDVVDFLKDDLKAKLGGEHPRLNENPDGPTVILVAGVNGAGKTTSIAKLTQHLAAEGKSVLLAASDTFRAAAIDQLKTWAERLAVEVVTGQPGQDPASVAYDAHEKAVARGIDYVIVDTAGRLHTEKNLMLELAKIARVGKKKIADSPHEVLLVLDATTGQNAVRQAAAFQEVLDVSGIFLAKLDGTAKGAVTVTIREQLGIPVKFVGLGEQATDIQPFDADRFVDALFA